LQQLLENGRVAVPRLSAAATCQIFRPANRGAAGSGRTTKLLKRQKPFERTTRSQNICRLRFPTFRGGKGDRHPLGARDALLGCTCTVAVMPCTNLMLSGTMSRWIRTGTRWASRTHVKTGFTSAMHAALGLDFLRETHQPNTCRVAIRDRSDRRFLEIAFDPK
jgi:hypothetical protein